MARSISDRISEFHHLTLQVTDLAVAERFYTEVLGAEVVRRMGTHFSIQFAGGPRIDVFGATQGPPRELQHPKYAFTIEPDDLKEIAAILDRHDVGYDGPVHQGPPGAAQIYFDDPFGNHFQLVAQGYADWASLKAGHDPSKLAYEWPKDGMQGWVSPASTETALPTATGPLIQGAVVSVPDAGRYDIKTQEQTVRPGHTIEILVNGKPICSYPNTGERDRKQSLGEFQTLQPGDQVMARIVDQQSGAAEALVVSIARLT
jgi:catechol 2,3-dioxygenase-like lactoylglutathione lyase family enzyme